MSWNFKRPPSMEGNVNNLIEKIGQWLLVVHQDQRFPCVSCLDINPTEICSVCFGTKFKSSLHLVKARISYDSEENLDRTNAGYFDREKPSIHFPRLFKPLPLDLAYNVIISNYPNGSPAHVLKINTGYRITSVIDRNNGNGGWWHSETQTLNQNYDLMYSVISKQNLTIHSIDSKWLKF